MHSFGIRLDFNESWTKVEVAWQSKQVESVRTLYFKVPRVELNTYRFFFSKKQLNGNDCTCNHDNEADEKDKMQDSVTIWDSWTTPATKLQREIKFISLHEKAMREYVIYPGNWRI